ncbi:hypothetical protein [Mesorhizobium sp. J428]|uniref:hypothetical protein n=1 Tax=Mesorhizobium sp. J428 TaxID=2898440 RepID=UPI0035AE320C
MFHIYSLGHRERNLDGIEIARIANGLTADPLLDNPGLLHDHQHQLAVEARHPMMEGIIQMSSHGQLVIVTPCARWRRWPRCRRWRAR